MPEDRLRAALLAAGVLVPVPILVSGLVTRYVPGTLGMGINLACLFINGVGVSPCYLENKSRLNNFRWIWYSLLLHHIMWTSCTNRVRESCLRTSEYTSLFCNVHQPLDFSGVRSLILAGSTMVTIPLINNIGVMSTDLIFAAICWIGFL